MSFRVPLEALLKRDRIVIISGLATISILAWAYMFYIARDMRNMAMAMEIVTPRVQVWGGVDFALTFVMWAVMMVAMMVPSAVPMVLTFATVNRRRREQRTPYASTGMFLLGYLIVWTGFSVLATLAQWAFHTAALLSPMMASTSPTLGGVLLLAAGIFQLTPLKHACLAHCRTPLGFFMTEWRGGTRGALIMGLRHGSFCVGCCWVLMVLLFVAGVMNLLWMAIITTFVLLEKVAPAGHWMGRVAGLLFIGWGAWVMAAGVIY